MQVVYRSFQLDPRAQNRTLTVQQLASEKGMTVEQLKAKQAQVAEMIKKESGLIANTFDAHRLVHFATKSGKGAELTERLFHAYLSQSWNIADHNVLASLGKEVGLNEQEVTEMLGSSDYKEAVLGDMAEARQLNISSLPAFVINHKNVISGAQSEEFFLNALNTIWDEENKSLQPEDVERSEEENSCTDGACNI